MDKIVTYISLFSGAGVGCYGFTEAGYYCIATNELIKKRLEFQKYNKKCVYDSGYISGDITQDTVFIQVKNELNKWKKSYNLKEPDVIIATPPCQGMSVANHKKKDEKGRNSLVVSSIKITQDLKPKFFVFENVRAFLNTICTDIDNEDKPISEAIELNLGGIYNIVSKVINFKDFGSQSSRTRTLVIGVRKDLKEITPYDFFPDSNEPKTLKKLIGDLPKLSKMGEICKTDIYHSFRTYDNRMVKWIENLDEGQSAFDNQEADRIPHRIIDGIKIYNKQKNGDKYKRWYWDRVAPCIHTRNDILASQNTIHPEENRVFSIREIMRMMTVPEKFNWSEIPFSKLNNLSDNEKLSFLKKNELNIRHCLGESVPTNIFYQIALKIKFYLQKKEIKTDVKEIVKTHKLEKVENLHNFLNKNTKKKDTKLLFNIAEFANSERLNTAAFYTRQDIVFSVIKALPDFPKRKSIRILEPSVGVGNFLPLLLKKYSEIENVIIDLLDIDNNALKILQIILKGIEIPNNITLNFINSDFLTWKSEVKYDLVVGNPPYKKITGQQNLLREYKQKAYNSDTNNLFSFFIEKAINISDYVSFIIPKSLINTPEFNKTRELLLTQNLYRICDYGETAFKGVKIETISIFINTKSTKSENIEIESYITNTITSQQKKYIFSNKFPYWLIYRNEMFDSVAEKLKFNIFSAFRDRQITKKITKEKGKYRVLKSRNIKNNAIEDIPDYDTYISEIGNLAVSKFLNKNNIVLIPNLTYHPRATFLPSNTITDGSVALLTLKNGSRLPTQNDLEYYNTKEFHHFYKIARNYGTRSLNIDNNSVFFFGLLKETVNE